jgi:hypothetical protein
VGEGRGAGEVHAHEPVGPAASAGGVGQRVEIAAGTETLEALADRLGRQRRQPEPAHRLPAAGLLVEVAEDQLPLPPRVRRADDEAMQAARGLSGGAPLILGELGRLRGRRGDRAGAEALLAELERLAELRYCSALDRAMVHLGLGAREETFQWLDRAYKERGDQFYWMKVNPRFDPLRDDPRFQDLLRRMRLA